MGPFPGDVAWLKRPLQVYSSCSQSPLGVSGEMISLSSDVPCPPGQRTRISCKQPAGAHPRSHGYTYARQTVERAYITKKKRQYKEIGRSTGPDFRSLAGPLGRSTSFSLASRHGLLIYHNLIPSGGGKSGRNVPAPGQPRPTRCLSKERWLHHIFIRISFRFGDIFPSCIHKSTAMSIGTQIS